MAMSVFCSIHLHRKKRGHSTLGGLLNYWLLGFDLIRNGADFLWHVSRLLGNDVAPPPISSIGIHRVHPTLRRCRFDFLSFIVALGFKNQMNRRASLDPNHEFWKVIVHFSIVSVGDSEAES